MNSNWPHRSLNGWKRSQEEGHLYMDMSKPLKTRRYIVPCEHCNKVLINLRVRDFVRKNGEGFEILNTIAQELLANHIRLCGQGQKEYQRLQKIYEENLEWSSYGDFQDFCDIEDALGYDRAIELTR